MLSTACPLFRARLARVITPSNICSVAGRRYYRPTRPGLADDKKPPTPTPPTTNKTGNTQSDQLDDQFFDLNQLLKDGQNAEKPKARAQQRSEAVRRKEAEEAEEAAGATLMSALKNMPRPSTTPIVQELESTGAPAVGEGERFEDEERPRDRDEEKFAEGLEDALRNEERKLVKKFQRKGMWDDVQARSVVEDILSDKQNELRTRGREGDSDTPESATARNQTYKLGETTLSIEHVDELTVRKNREHLNQLAAGAQELYERNEEEVIADQDPELIDALLDRPSKIDRTVAAKDGEEILKFYSQEELELAEQNKGKLPTERMNKAKSRIVASRKRGPAITKNEAGADAISLLYDEAPPTDRAIIKFRDPLRKLKFLPIYPQKVRKWVTYMRHCKGRYDKWGYWENDMKLQEHENEVREHLKVRARQHGEAGMMRMVEKRKRQILPPDLDGHYRFGVQPDELIGIHPKVKEMLSFRHANNSEIHAFRKQQQVKRWQTRPDDHGTPQVQIACMTNRVNYLTEHLQKNKKDKQCKLSLRKLLGRRQALLKYLRQKNVPVYYQLVRELDIQDISF